MQADTYSNSNCCCYLSNLQEKLLQHLKENLFCKQSSPFSKRLVILPSKPLEKWIRLQLAQSDVGVAAGFSVFFLNEGVEFLKEALFICQKPKPIPSVYALQLKIEKEIRTLLKEENSDFVWQPLYAYLNGKSKKIPGLSKQLATLFHRYAIYGKEETSEWKKKPKDWQEALWSRVFQEWGILSEELLHLSPKALFYSQDLSVHIFGFSHLSALHMQFFLDVAEHIPVSFYHFSPCQEFWSDIRSDKEMRTFFSHRKMTDEVREQWENLLFDRHSFLANLGKVGREFAVLLEEMGIQTIESYEEPKRGTKLSFLQSEILHLEANKLEQPKEDFLDSSIQVHVSTTLNREIQNLHNFVLDLISQENIEPKDILVMAPDISAYIPFIRAVFGKKVSYRITDVLAEKVNPHIEGFFQLFYLEEKRWSAFAILELFRHPLFAKKRGWHEKDHSLFKLWVQETGIRWGIDLTHRNELLKKNHCSDQMLEGNGTWQQGIDLLFQHLMSSQEREIIHFTEVDLLSDLILTLRSLKEDLTPFHNESERSLKSWGAYLKSLDEKYFSFSESREIFSEMVERLEKIDAPHPSVYPFSSIFPLLQELFSSEELSINGHNFQSVQFCSMLPMRAIPSKVICLLGMNENAFPRKEKLQVLDLLKQQKKGDYYPTRTEFDRYLFLEAVLSTRDYFFLSYLSHSPVDQAELGPSSMIQELLASLNNAQIVIHPASSFDPRYFNPTEKLPKNYSLTDYKAACALLFPKPAICSLNEASKAIKKELPNEIWIDLSELSSCIKRPLRHYFHQTLKIRLNDDKELKEEEDFALTPIANFKLQKDLLFRPTYEVVSKLSKEGKLPSGLFQKAALMRIESQTRNLSEFLKGHVGTSGSLMSFEFLPHQEQALQVSEKLWKLPYIQIPYGEKTIVKIIGKIDGVFSEGWITLEKGDLKGAVRSLPSFLLLKCIPSSFKPFRCENLLFMKDGTKKEIGLEDPQKALYELIDFYFYCTHSPSYLFPEWIESILKCDLEKLKRKIEQSLQGDWGAAPLIEAQWLHRKNSLPSAEEILEKEKECAEKLYKEILHAWL